MLTDDEIGELEAGTWGVDCTSMRLERHGDRPPTRLSGAGRVQQGRDGSLRFTLYARQDFHHFVGPRGGEEQPLGKFIPRSDYYRWFARDVDGRLWEADWVLVDEPAVIVGVEPSEEPGSIWQGALGIITSVSDIERSGPKDMARCFAFVAVRFPPTGGTTKVTKTPRTQRFESELNCANFDVDPVTCELETRPGRSTLTVWAPPPIDTHVLLLLADGIQFVLSTPFEWAVTVVEGRTSTRTTIYQAALAAARNDQLEYRLHVPAPERSANPPMRMDTWRLLGCFVNYISDARGPDRHWLAAQLGAVLRSSAASLETQALITSVAVEAVVTFLVDSTLITAPDHLDRWFDIALTALADKECPDNVSGRIIRALDTMKRPSAASRLFYLATMGAVGKSHVEAWKRLRNAVAHGGTLGDTLQDASRDVDTVTTLLYTLIFHAINYRGRYRDRGDIGWPIRRYEPGPGGPARTISQSEWSTSG